MHQYPHIAIPVGRVLRYQYFDTGRGLLGITVTANTRNIRPHITSGLHNENLIIKRVFTTFTVFTGTNRRKQARIFRGIAKHRALDTHGDLSIGNAMCILDNLFFDDRAGFRAYQSLLDFAWLRTGHGGIPFFRRHCRWCHIPFQVFATLLCRSIACTQDES